MPKSLLTEYRLELSSFLSLLLGVLSVIGIIGEYVNLGNELTGSLSILNDLVSPFGNWVAWLAVAGPIGFVICVWWLYDYVKKTKQLSKLIDTPSKAKFVRNLDDIEYLAWSLPQRFEDQVIEKKRDLKI